MAHRRNLPYFPFFLIALLVQVFAPVGSSLAMARASSDPLAATAICAGGDSVSSRKQSPRPPQSDEDCCPLCHFVHSGAAPLPALAAEFVPKPVPPTRIVWAMRKAPSTDFLPGARPRARAPPAGD